MGDKKLKAIVVRGHGKIEVAEPERFMKVVSKCYQKCQDTPNKEMWRKAPLNFYTDPEWMEWNTNIVVKNGQDDYWERKKGIELMNPKTGIPSMQKRVRACYCCPIGCMPYMEINKGKYKGTQDEGL